MQHDEAKIWILSTGKHCLVRVTKARRGVWMRLSVNLWQSSCRDAIFKLIKPALWEVKYDSKWFSSHCHCPQKVWNETDLQNSLLYTKCGKFLGLGMLSRERYGCPWHIKLHAWGHWGKRQELCNSFFLRNSLGLRWREGNDLFINDLIIIGSILGRQIQMDLREKKPGLRSLRERWGHNSFFLGNSWGLRQWPHNKVKLKCSFA